MSKENDGTTRVTKWLPKSDEDFCLDVGEFIKKNHGDDSWIKTDGKGRIALFRNTKGMPIIKYLV